MCRISLGPIEWIDQLRVRRLDRGEQLLVVLDAVVRVVAALEHHLGRAQLDRLAAAAQDLLGRVGPALGVLRRAVERAELARRHADVGVVDVAVDQVGDDVVRVAAAAHRVRRLAEGVERRVGVEQQRLLGRDPPAVGAALQDVVDLPAPSHAPEPTSPFPFHHRVARRCDRSSGRCVRVHPKLDITRRRHTQTSHRDASHRDTPRHHAEKSPTEITHRNQRGEITQRRRRGRPAAAAARRRAARPDGRTHAARRPAARPREKSSTRKYDGQRRRVEGLPPGRGRRHLVQLGQAQLPRAQERLVHLFHLAGVRGGELPPHRPHREDHRQPGPLPPGLPEVRHDQAAPRRLVEWRAAPRRRSTPRPPPPAASAVRSGGQVKYSGRTPYRSPSSIRASSTPVREVDPSATRPRPARPTAGWRRY